METDQSEEISLHYKMLDYIFNTRGLNSICFGYFWDTFRSENIEFQCFNSGALKEVFCEQILPNINDYELLNDNAKAYFKQEDFLNIEEEDFGTTFDNNEPKGGGKDFLFKSSISEDESESDSDQKSLNDIFRNKTTYKGTFNDTDSDLDEFCVKIKTSKPSVADETSDIFSSIIKPFNLLLRAENEKPRDLQEVLLTLENEEVVSNIECFNGFPRGLQEYLSQFDFFRNQKSLMGVEDAAEDVSMETDNSELDVPDIEFPSFKEPLSDVTNSSNERLLRSRSLQSSSTSSNRKVRTKTLKVQNPAVNAHMNTFVTGFKAAKRRRMTQSPESAP